MGDRMQGEEEKKKQQEKIALRNAHPESTL